MPTWPSGDPQASAYPGTATSPPGPYRNKLGALQPSGRGATAEISVNEGEPDMFLANQYCIRHTFVTGGVKAGSAVRSEYWWAGVVAGYGVQIFVVGTKSIIDLDQARGLKDAVVLSPAG
ncbi:MAG: hypothetical protein ACRDNF_22885 [Streptosporangiaceae bacterium]